MPRVVFTRHLQQHINAPPALVTGQTVRQVLDEVFRGNPQARGYILDEQGMLRKHVAVFVDGQMIADRVGLSDRVGESSEVYVLQALSGG
jgi:sulfur carrier protein ThiS